MTGEIGVENHHLLIADQFNAPNIAAKALRGFIVARHVERTQRLQPGKRGFAWQQRLLDGRGLMQLVGHAPLVFGKTLDQPAALQKHPDAVKQLAGIEGLGQQVGRAASKGLSAQVRVDAGGLGENGDVAGLRIGPQLAAEFEAVHVGHQQIGDDQLGTERIHRLQRFEPVADHADIREAARPQMQRNEASRGAIIVDHQNSGGGQVLTKPGLRKIGRVADAFGCYIDGHGR